MIVIAACSWGSAPVWAESGVKSQYTSIAIQDCWVPPASLKSSFEARGVSVQECPALEGWRLFVVSSDAHSWIEIAHGSHLWSSEDQVVYRNEFGHFPNLGAERVEWRRKQGGIPVALIFRVSAQDPAASATGSGARNVSRLFVIGFQGNNVRFCGTARTNEEARVLSDNVTKCVQDLPERKLDSQHSDRDLSLPP
jgi:hypothetical protein